MTCVKHRAFRNGVFIRISEFMLLFQVAVGNHVCVLEDHQKSYTRMIRQSAITRVFKEICMSVVSHFC